jgi:hypothetical protein
MFLDVLIVVKYLSEGTAEYAVWGFDGEDGHDVMKQARLQADNNNSASKLVKWVPVVVGHAGSFDHKIGQQLKK